MVSQKKKFRILLADDHVLIRHGIKNILKKDKSFEVVGEVTDGKELIEFIEKDPVELIILDISMPRLGGMEVVKLAKSKYPGTKILMLTMHKGKNYFYNAMSAGADGYLLKDDSDGELLVAIEKVLSGKNYITPSLSDDFTNDVIAMYRNETKSPLQKLTKRENQILQFVVKGLTSKQIAKELYLSQRTIDHHRASLLRKFNLKNSIDLVNYAVRNGLVDID